MKVPAIKDGNETYPDGTPKSICGFIFKCDQCYSTEKLIGFSEDSPTDTPVEEAEEHICAECLGFFYKLHVNTMYKVKITDLFVEDL